MQVNVRRWFFAEENRSKLNTANRTMPTTGWKRRLLQATGMLVRKREAASIFKWCALYCPSGSSTDSAIRAPYPSVVTAMRAKLSSSDRLVAQKMTEYANQCRSQCFTSSLRTTTMAQPTTDRGASKSWLKENAKRSAARIAAFFKMRPVVFVAYPGAAGIEEEISELKEKYRVTDHKFEVFFLFEKMPQKAKGELLMRMLREKRPKKLVFMASYMRYIPVHEDFKPLVDDALTFVNPDSEARKRGEVTAFDNQFEAAFSPVGIRQVRGEDHLQEVGAEMPRKLGVTKPAIGKVKPVTILDMLKVTRTKRIATGPGSGPGRALGPLTGTAESFWKS